MNSPRNSNLTTGPDLLNTSQGYPSDRSESRNGNSGVKIESCNSNEDMINSRVNLSKARDSKQNILNESEQLRNNCQHNTEDTAKTIHDTKSSTKTNSGVKSTPQFISLGYRKQEANNENVEVKYL